MKKEQHEEAQAELRFIRRRDPGNAERRRFPRSVFPPCSSCGQDHHPSWECANEAPEV